MNLLFLSPYYKFTTMYSISIINILSKHVVYARFIMEYFY